MSEILLELAKWATPLIAGWLLSRQPLVKRWAIANWTKSVVIMTALATISIMGFGSFIYYAVFKPYIIVCDQANACLSMKMSDLKNIKDQSNAAVAELRLMYDPNVNKVDGLRDWHINEGNRMANVTNDSINALYDKIYK